MQLGSEHGRRVHSIHKFATKPPDVSHSQVRLVFHQEVLNGYADGSAAEYVVKVYAMLMAVLTMEKRQNSTHGSALGSAEMK